MLQNVPIKMAMFASRKRKISALCVTIVCSVEDDNEEGIRKKKGKTGNG